LSSSLQAEVMFWLAEGAQKRGNQQKALENYLKLAWEYPQEHIWAVTALYRSALIYEQQGRLNAAKRLLEQVLDRADRDSQKKAAEDRIEAIERKMDQGVSAPELDYLL
jgi:TolA-binding protein